MVDLALGHVKAVEKLEKDQGLFIYDLGTVSVTVLDVVKAFEKANGVDIPYEIKPRPGRRYCHLLLRPLQG